METKRFLKNDNGFICSHCGKKVEPLGKSSRNHCPFCLWSLHLDENPGDRASDCGGEMEPISAEINSKKGYVIVHKCKKCGAVKKCKAAYGPNIKQPDDINLIMELMSKRG